MVQLVVEQVRMCGVDDQERGGVASDPDGRLGQHHVPDVLASDGGGSGGSRPVGACGGSRPGLAESLGAEHPVRPAADEGQTARRPERGCSVEIHDDVEVEAQDPSAPVRLRPHGQVQHRLCRAGAYAQGFQGQHVEVERAEDERAVDRHVEMPVRDTHPGLPQDLDEQQEVVCGRVLADEVAARQLGGHVEGAGGGARLGRAGLHRVRHEHLGHRGPVDQ